MVKDSTKVYKLDAYNLIQRIELLMRDQKGIGKVLFLQNNLLEKKFTTNLLKHINQYRPHIIVLFCDYNAAVIVLNEARNSGMTASNGWIWLETNSVSSSDHIFLDTRNRLNIFDGKTQKAYFVKLVLPSILICGIHLSSIRHSYLYNQFISGAHLTKILMTKKLRIVVGSIILRAINLIQEYDTYRYRQNDIIICSSTDESVFYQRIEDTGG